MPAAHRLVSVTALLLTAAAANSVGRAQPVTQWVPLVVVAVVGAVVAGAPTRLWPLPAIWVVATLLVAATGAGVDARAVVVSLTAGGIVLVAAVLADVLPGLVTRRRRSRS